MSTSYFAVRRRRTAELELLERGREGEELAAVRDALVARSALGLSEEGRLRAEFEEQGVTAWVGADGVEVYHSASDRTRLLEAVEAILEVLLKEGLFVYDPQRGAWRDMVEGEAGWRAVIDDRSAASAERHRALDKLGEALMNARYDWHAYRVLSEAVEARPRAVNCSWLGFVMGRLPNPDYAARIAMLVRASRLKAWWVDYHQASLSAEALGDLEQAIAWEALAWRTAPMVAAAKRLMELLRKQGKADARLAFAKDLVRRLDKDPVFAHWQRYAAPDDAGDTADALAAAREAYAHDPRAFGRALRVMLSKRANALAVTGEVEAGQLLMDEMLALNPTVSDRLNAAKFAYHHRHDVERAEQTYRALRAEEPGDLWVQSNYGEMLRAIGRHAEAVDMLRRAFEEDPANSFRATNYANCLMEMHRPAGAERVLFTNLARSASPASSLHFLGHLYHDLGRFDDARATWSEGLACKPDFLKLHFDLWLVEKDAGRLEDGLAQLERGRDKDPSYEFWDKGLAEYHLLKGDLERAHALCQAGLDAFPTSAGWGFRAADVAIAQGDASRAEQLLRAVVEKEPRHFSAWFTLGEVLLQTDRPEEARGALVRAVETNTSNRRDRYDALVRVLDVLGDDEARRVAEASRDTYLRSWLEADVQGFTAAPDFARPPVAPPVEPVPAAKKSPSDQHATDVLENACLLLGEMERDALFQRCLEHEVEGLDLSAMGQRIRDLRGLDPSGCGGVQERPYRLALRGLRWGERWLGELERDVAKLREAASSLLGRIPARAGQRVFAGLDRLRWRTPFAQIEWDPEDYSILDFADSAHQFDTFPNDLARLNEYGQTEVLWGWSNGMTELPLEALELPRLQIATLNDNRFETFPRALLSCPSLRVLDLSGNPIRAIPLGVEALARLELLDLRRTALPDAAVTALREQLPGCHILRHDQGPNGALFDLVLACPDAVIRDETEIAFSPSGPILTHESARTIVAARATLGAETDVPCVLRVQGDSGEGAVWHRDATGRWVNRTSDASDVRAAFALVVRDTARLGPDGPPSSPCPGTPRRRTAPREKDASFRVFIANGATLAQAAEALGPMVSERRPRSLVIGGAGFVLKVRRRGTGVAQDARELAEEKGVPALARCVKCFEVTIDDLEACLDEINTLIDVQAQLEELAEGWTHRRWNDALTGPGVPT